MFLLQVLLFSILLNLLASERIEELNGLISPFILRRTKQEVLLEIPSLTVEDIECPLTETQEALYYYK